MRQSVGRCASPAIVSLLNGCGIRNAHKAHRACRSGFDICPSSLYPLSPPQPWRIPIHPYPYLSQRTLYLSYQNHLTFPLLSTLPQKKPGCSMAAFLSRTHIFHACPTRAPGDAIRMHSVLSTFFQAPVSGEEKKRCRLERISGSCPHLFPHSVRSFVSQGSARKKRNQRKTS